MSVSSMSGNGGIRICLTEEDIKRDAIPVSDGKCTSTVKSRTASRWVVSNSCTEPAMTGEAEVVFEGSQAYRVHAKGVVTQQGRQQPFDMKHAHAACVVGLRCSEAGVPDAEAVTCKQTQTAAEKCSAAFN
jgi:hypothetical protein